MAGPFQTHYHLVPGRLRLKLASLKRDESRARAVERALALVDGVHDVRANTLTGSVVVRFASDRVGFERIVDTLRAHGFMHDHAPLRSASFATPPLADALVNHAVEQLVLRCATALAAALI